MSNLRREIQNLKFTVLGAGGFIGTNLCKKIISYGGQVRAFGRSMHFPEAFEGIDWITGDFNDASSLALAVEGADIVYHLVSSSTPSIGNIDKISDAQNSILSTLKLLDICKSEKVKKIVFTSSGGTVYGINAQIPTPETAQMWPITGYGISKIAIEKYLYLYNYLYGIDYSVLRLSNPYGPYQTALKNQGIIPSFIKKSFLGQPIEVWGDGETRRDYIYIDDVIEAMIITAIKQTDEKILNIGSGTSYSINNIITILEKSMKKSIEASYQQGRKVDIPVSCLDINLASKSINWSPKTDIESGVDQTRDWLKNYLADRI